MSDSPNIALLRRAFVDICQGYSVGHLEGGQRVYIRHLGHKQHIAYDDFQAAFESEAKAKGAQTEAQVLERLYRQGIWSAEKEKDIARRRDFIARMEDTRKTIAIPSILRSHEAQIKTERDALVAILMERAKAIGQTVESYAYRRLEDHYLIHNIFLDSEFRQPAFGEDLFDNLNDEEVEKLYTAYKEATEPCSDANLRRLAIQDFFVSYYVLCSDRLDAFFGRAICDLTYYQVRLANVARHMKFIMENMDLTRLEANQRCDPEAVEQAYIVQKNVSDMAQNGKMPTGLTSQDMKETGLKERFSPVPPPGLSGVELVKWLRKNNQSRSIVSN